MGVFYGSKFYGLLRLCYMKSLVGSSKLRSSLAMKLVVSLVFAMTLAGCASIFGDSKDMLVINSSDPHATILVNGLEVGQGSAQYALPRGRDATIPASRKGCSDRSVQTEKRIVGATWLNIFFWPGFLIDIASGSMHKADPTHYTVTPKC